ncbi:MAG: peptidase, partial [Gammaproteobacteria bacterium]
QGRVLEVELEEKHARLQYEIKLLTPDHRFLEIKVDARTGELIKVERE